MLNLNLWPTGWAFRQRSILLQRLVKFLYRPPLLIDLQRPIDVEFVIVCTQIESASSSVLVFKDVLYLISGCAGGGKPEGGSVG